jgi:hypothetical protein
MAGPGTTAALAIASAGCYTGPSDGVTYTLRVGQGATPASTPFTWAATGAATETGLGTATNGTAAAVGTEGVTVTFADGDQYPAGSTYSVQAGSLPATALALGAGPAAIVTQAGTDSPAPVAANTGATVPADGPAVPFLVAAAGTGMGSYQVGPSLTLYPDATAWADASYAATLTYTMAAGPGSPPPL